MSNFSQLKIAHWSKPRAQIYLTVILVISSINDYLGDDTHDTSTLV